MLNKAFFVLSLILVAFGQPSSIPVFGLISAAFGFALFFSILTGCESKKARFWLGASWYGLVQMVQLFWALGHPFSYIYAVYLIHVLLLGLQFGLFSLFITRQNLTSLFGILGLSGFWVLLEWVRLLFFSGHPWNPVGLALAGNFYSMQLASLWGVYGLSFWVMLVNLYVLGTWLSPSRLKWAVALVLMAVPYLYGFAQWQAHERAYSSPAVSRMKVGLVQTAFPIEEMLPVDRNDLFALVKREWREILALSKKAAQNKVQLIALPELVVPYGTNFLVYDYEEVVRAFKDIYGPVAAGRLPGKLPHLSREVEGVWKVNNAFWAQGLANVTGSDVIAGLEDRDYLGNGKFRFHTAAYLFRPFTFATQRYEKRVLVPMGEYIPFAFLRELAARYGVMGSFTCGTCAKIFKSNSGPLGISICYEETLGSMMRESRLMGAEALVNITNDGWFPNYGLPRVHLEHSRLRTVEMGIPLVRACNTGITVAIDSFGRDISRLGKTPYEEEHTQDILIADVPLYSYATPYTFFGDWLIVALSSIFVLAWAAWFAYNQAYN